MAKIEYSALLNSISGRVGGSVFSRWQGIPVLRRFVNPSQPRTALQVQHRNVFRNMLAAFGELPSVNHATPAPSINDLWRVSWQQFASGQPGQARNFFIADILAKMRSGVDVNLEDIDLLVGSGSVGAPAIAVGSYTATHFPVTLSALPTPPNGFEFLGELVVGYLSSVNVSLAALPVLKLNGVTGGSGSAHNLTGFVAADEPRILGCVVYKPAGVTTGALSASQVRFSGIAAHQVS